MDKKKLLTNIFFTLIYAIFTFVTVSHHEIWADEAQVWLVVRDLDLWGIINHVRTEGHPLLWYMVISILAKLNLPIITMQFLNWLILVVGAAFYLFKSPFNIFCKVSILCSSAFLYWFPVISRSYCLIPILIALLSWLYQKQKVHPYLYILTLIFLANTHIIMFGFACALASLFIYENIFLNKDKNNIFSIILLITSILSIIIYLFGSQNENYIVQNYAHNFSLEGIKIVYSKFIFNLYGNSNLFTMFAFGLFIFMMGIILFLKDKKILFVYIINLLYQSAIFIFIWSILPQRAYAYLFVCVFCIWVIYARLQKLNQKVLVNLMLSLIFLLSLPEGINMITKDLKTTFSDGKNTAEFIKKNIPEDAFILSNYPITTTSVSAYLPKEKWKLWYEGYNDFYTYTIWNKPIPPSFTPVPLAEKMNKYKTVYVIMSAGSFYEDIEPIYSSSENILTNQERFNIYKLKR